MSERLINVNRYYKNNKYADNFDNNSDNKCVNPEPQYLISTTHTDTHTHTHTHTHTQTPSPTHQ